MDKPYYIYCRLCAEPKQADQFYNTQESVHKISLKLNRINAMSNFAEAALPKTVCNKCMSALNEAFQFVIAVEKAQILLEQKVDELQEERASDHEKSTCVPVVVKSEVFEDITHHSNEQSSFDIDFEAQDPPKTDTIKVAQSLKPKAKKPNKKLFNLCDYECNKQKLTWKDYLWSCSDCGTIFQSQCELTKHSMQVHNICNPYRCSDCNIRKDNLNQFMKHVKQHKNYLRFSCYKCFKEFTGPRMIYKHKCYGRTDHVCKGCNEAFQSKEELSKHYSTYFRDLCPSTKTYTDLDKVDLVNMACKICNKVFKRKKSLIDHVAIHSVRYRNHICETCGKSYYNMSDLKNHVVAHSDERPFECDICQQRFKTRTRITVHLRNHNLVKRFPCEQCGRSFKLKKQLSYHSVIHTDLRPYVCSYCKKAFRFRGSLEQHIRLHTGIRPYSCKVCGRDFVNWANYNKHMKRRHNMDMSKKKQTSDIATSTLVTV